MFNGSNLRLARLYHELSLEQVAERVNKTRQYIQRLESGFAVPTNELSNELATVLQVTPAFFETQVQSPVNEEIVHFRKRSAIRVATKLAALAKAELYRRLIVVFEENLNLPPVLFPELKANSPEEVERAAEKCRIDWGLGFGPIENVTRLAEKLGAFVTSNRFFGPCPPPGLPVNVMVNNLKALRAFRLISPPALGEGLRRILLKFNEMLLMLTVMEEPFLWAAHQGHLEGEFWQMRSINYIGNKENWL